MAEVLGMASSPSRSESAGGHKREREDEDDLSDLLDGIAEGVIEGDGEGIPLGPAVGASYFPLFELELELQEPAAMAELLGMSAASRRSERAV